MESLVVRENLIAAGCPVSLAERAAAAGIDWLKLLMIAAHYGPVVWALVQRDLEAGKSWLDIFKDLIDALKPTTSPAVLAALRST